MILFLSIVCLTCGEKKSINGPLVSKVVDKPWQGDPATIPTALQQKNPAASAKAKKGGTIRVFGGQFPKSLNYYLDQFSTTGEVFAMMYETLTARHPITLEIIPHLAKSWQVSANKKKFTFHIDQNARWSDDKPITAQDVLFTYNTIMNPKNDTAIFRIGLSRFEKPVVKDAYTIEFTAKNIHWNNFETVAGIYILPKHAYQGKDFNKINFSFPVVSGPYQLKAAKKGRYILMRRRGDYWQRAYPFNEGRYNFDEIYFKVSNERNLALRAFKKGDIDFFAVYTAQFWAQETKGEAFVKNWIVKHRVFNQKPAGFQGWAMNMRREIFQDILVRKAIAHLVPRRMYIEKLMFNEYKPTHSYYPDFYILDGKTPNEEFHYDQQKARQLLQKAGWQANAQGILEKNGKPLAFSVLERDHSTSKYITPFIERAKEVGIKVTIDTTDLAGWSKRMDSYDFDITWAAWGAGIFKDPEPIWSSRYADENGQNNLPGLKIPAVDKLIEKQKTIFNLAQRNEILKQIDKIVYKQFPYVLLWHLDNTRILYWNQFGMPQNPLGKYGGENTAYEYWWYDSKKAEDLKKARKAGKALPGTGQEIKSRYSQ